MNIILFTRTRPVITGIVILVVLVVGISITSAVLSPDASPYETVEAGYSDVIQQVSVTGRVQPVSDATLAFDRSGRVARVYASIGDHVSAGTVLVSLDNADSRAALAGSEASLAAEQSKLDALLNGARPEEIIVKQGEVLQAGAVLEVSKQGALDALISASTVADDAVRNHTNQMFDNPETSFPHVSFVTEYTQQMGDGRVAAGTYLKELVTISTGATVSDNLTEEISKARSEVTLVLSFLNICAIAVNDLKTSTGSTLSQTTIDSYRSSVATARTNLNATLSALSAAQNSLSSATQALSLSQSQLTLLTAPPTVDSVNQAKAALAAAQANVDASRATLRHTYITAPFTGEVTQMDAKVGQIAVANTSLVAMIAPNVFKIEAYVPEADIAKVRVGQSASTTLDAYGYDVVFPTLVTSIDPAETIKEGVATYKVVLQFQDTKDLAKSGMTTNVDIATGERIHVISVPARAVVLQDNRKYVRVLQEDGSVKDVEVETGLRGSLGTIEITVGISEGDKVIVYGAS